MKNEDTSVDRDYSADSMAQLIGLIVVHVVLAIIIIGIICLVKYLVK